MLLTLARGQGCADRRLPSLLSSLSGHLLTPGDDLEEEENLQGALSDAAEGEDRGRPSRVFEAKNAPDPIHYFADGPALDLKQKSGSDSKAEAE